MKIDIGCGPNKRSPNHIGLDYIAAPGVDHVLNIETDRFPLDDDSVDEAYSSHCFEHIARPDNVWREISRVIKPGGQIEIITPYCWHNDYLLPGHVSPWSRTQWSQLACLEQRHWYSENFLQGGYWRWIEACYLIDTGVQDRFSRHNIPLELAIHHHVNVASEWLCHFEYVAEDPGAHAPAETFRNSRAGERRPIAR